MANYDKIKNFIFHVKNDFRLDISLKDFCGFVSSDKDLDNVLRPYLAHTNPYCLFVKETQKGYMRCLAQKKPMYEKCKKGKPFIGYCHAGVGELVVPIIKDGYAIGSINVAHFSYDVKTANRLVENTFKTESVKRREDGVLLYRNFMKNSSIDVSGLLFSLEMLAEYLGNVATIAINESTNIAYSRKLRDERASLLEEIDKYISEHYAEKIELANVSKEIGATQKTISLTITSLKEMSFTSYLNNYRIEMSKDLLLKSDMTIDEIAKAVGFNDKNYFKKVFNEHIGILPSKFIEYYKNETLQFH